MKKPAETQASTPEAQEEVPFTRQPVFAYLVATALYLTILSILFLSAVV